MQQYLDLLTDIINNGVEKEDRTGVGTHSVFGRQLRFNLQDGFPLVTTKKLHVKSIIHELLWFIAGDTNVKYLQDKGVRIWNEWATEDGNTGPIYGWQWRNYGADYASQSRSGLDQLEQVIQQIKDNPDSRRILVCAWNPLQIEEMSLPPCHCLFQFYVAAGKISCHMYQRSADVVLGVPFNIASYSLLTSMVAQVTDLVPYEFIHTFGDVHIYKNHLSCVKEQLSREPRALPKLVLNPRIKRIDDFKYEDFVIADYRPHPAIKVKVAV